MLGCFFDIVTITGWSQGPLGMRRNRPRMGSALVKSSLLTILLFSGCTSSNPTPTSGNTSSSPRAAASLVATPNPVPAGLGFGTTTITWNTGDGSVGQVYVSRDAEPEKMFAQGPQGTVEAPWIATASKYDFRLYAAMDHKKLLTAVRVTRVSGK